MAWPGLDTSAIRGVGHSDVVCHYVFDDICLSFVLAQGADRNAVGASASEILDNNIDTTWFEGNTIVAIVYAGILDNDVVAIECTARDLLVWVIYWRI